MQTIHTFFNLAEAGFAQSLLESFGIAATLADEYAFSTVAMSASGGIRLQVAEPDIPRAVEILAQREEFAPLPEDFIPPAPPAHETALRVVPAPESNARSAFVRGGFWCLAIAGVFTLLTIAGGGEVHIDFGGLLLLFVLGGAAGLIVRGIYHKGKRDALDKQ